MGAAYSSLKVKARHPQNNYKSVGCGCFVDTNTFWLILQFEEQVNLEKFNSSETFRNLKLRFIKRFNIESDVLFDETKYEYKFNHQQMSSFDDNKRIQEIYSIIFYTKTPIQLLYKSKNIDENIKKNQILWQNQFDSLQSLIISATNNMLNDGIVLIISQCIFGEKSSLNFPLPLLYDNELKQQKYIYQYFVNDEILSNAMKYLGISQSAIINGKHLQQISCDNNKLQQYVTFIKNKRIECNDNAICELCHVHDYSDGSGLVHIKVEINNEILILNVHHLATVKQLKKLIQIKGNIHCNWNQQRLIYAPHLL